MHSYADEKIEQFMFVQNYYFWSAFKYLKALLHNIPLPCNKFSLIFLVLHSSCNKSHFKWTIITFFIIIKQETGCHWPEVTVLARELKTLFLWVKPTGVQNSSSSLEEFINTRTTTIIMVKSVSKFPEVMHVFLALSLMNSGWLMISCSYIMKNLSFNAPFH